MSKRYNTQALRTLIHEELEPRFLFSADAVPGLDINAAHELVLTNDIVGELQGGLDTGTETAAADAPAIELRRELVIVNENVADYEGLIAGLQDSDPNRVIEVVTLDSGQNGIEQVSEILAEHSGLDSIHIISHGSDGQFALGSDWLDSTDLLANSEAISAWSNALNEDADILLYGCNIAVDQDGQNLTETLAQLTGADVAASDDMTGHEDLGGDWELEYEY